MSGDGDGEDQRERQQRRAGRGARIAGGLDQHDRASAPAGRRARRRAARSAAVRPTKLARARTGPAASSRDRPCRCSTHRKAASSAAPARDRRTGGGGPPAPARAQGQAPGERAQRRRWRATAPGTGRAAGRRPPRSLGTKRQARPIAPSASGRLMRRSRASRPCRSASRRAPAPARRPWRRSPPRCRSRGPWPRRRRWRRGWPGCWASASPRRSPARARPHRSQGRSGARAQASEAAANRPRPQISTTPPAEAVAERAAEQQQGAQRQQIGVDHPLQIAPAPACRLRPIAGRPTLTTEPSTKARLEARMQVASTSRGCSGRRAGWRGDGVGGVAGWNEALNSSDAIYRGWRPLARTIILRPSRRKSR